YDSEEQRFCSTHPLPFAARRGQMKPSVHLQYLDTGKYWVGACTGEPEPSNFIWLGCGDFCVGRSPDADLQLSHSFTSRKHAMLRLIDCRLYLQDLRSRAGTQINDVPRWQGWGYQLPPTDPVDDWEEIHVSDVLRFGEAAVQVLWLGEGLNPFTPEQLSW